MAADEVIEATWQVPWCLDGFHGFMKVSGWVKIDAPLFDDFLAKECFTLVVIQPLRIASLALHGSLPVLGNHTEMDLVNVAVLDCDV